MITLKNYRKNDVKKFVRSFDNISPGLIFFIFISAGILLFVSPGANV
jgi:hypothetical protein